MPLQQQVKSLKLQHLLGSICKITQPADGNCFIIGEITQFLPQSTPQFRKSMSVNWHSDCLVSDGAGCVIKCLI